ncbi:hypothetical protein DH2020_006332 [Rehmannia glutinosa]|uniref:Integrase zinc-binding domain-containing protein n=1 Tax=Rehmannia glutinosa TaxID=99300 RepID=A0ABR0XIQ0_REHGL
MYRDLREAFWWRSMKRDIGSFVEKCLICQQVKAEHQRPSGLLKPLEIPEWKWEHITMDFVVGLPRSAKGNKAVWVVVDRLTKLAHFLPVKMMFSKEQYAQIYQATIGMAPYEALYGRKCRSPLYWSEVGEKKMWGPELVRQTVEKIAKIQDRIRTAQDRQKSYADRRRKDLQFEVGDNVFLKVAP